MGKKGKRPHKKYVNWESTKKSRQRGLKRKNIKIVDKVFPEEIQTEKHHINNFFIIEIPILTHRIFEPKKGWRREDFKKKHISNCNTFLEDILGFPIRCFLSEQELEDMIVYYGM